MNNELIVVRQLPVIEEQLRQIKDNIEARVREVLSLACTEDTYKTVKKARTELNREYGELESRRKEVKAAILAPYEKFEVLYKECAGDIYAQADAQLKARITEVEDGLRQQKQEEVSAYFGEYRQSLGLDSTLATYEVSGIKVTLSASLKSLKEQAKVFLDHVAADLAAIEVQEFKDEILVEYRKTLNFAVAVRIVNERHQAIEQERQAREQADVDRARRESNQRKVETIVAETAPLAPPVATQSPEPDAIEQTFCTSFKVTGTLEKLKALKQFLNDGGYIYEQS